MKYLYRSWWPVLALPAATTVLAVLRLTGVTRPSWWLVFAPVWIPLLLLAAAIALDWDALDRMGRR